MNTSAGLAGQAGWARADGELAQPDVSLEGYRVELTGFCYRMLGSPFDAQDAVQETFLRAWRSRARFDQDRGSLRPWLYRIATNVCLDALRGARRRALVADLAPPSRPGPDVGAPLPEATWVQPIPDPLAVPADADPAEQAALRDTVRLAFVAALQRLPPRQRAVLILRDVLCWRADEVAGLLDVTPAAVTSALQRARTTLRTSPGLSHDHSPLDEEHRRLLVRYCDAFERYDVETLVSLLHEDATTSMPPYLWWLQGRNDIRRSLLASDGYCRGARLVPTAANGSPAFGQYLPLGADGGYVPFALLVFRLADGLIREETVFLDADRLFPLFGLPSEPDPR